MSDAIPPNNRSSSAAERMRRHRERRRRGLFCVTVDLHESEIDALIGASLLQSEMRRDQNAVLKALYAFLDRTLGADRDAKQ
jgi:hypothetical protein